MSTSSPNTVLAKKPISVLQKPIKADTRGLFKGLLKVVGHGVSGKWADWIGDAGEIGAALNLKVTPEERAWVLIHRALQQALYELISPNTYLLPSEADQRMKEVSDQIDGALEAHELSINGDFFAHPKNLALLETVQADLKQWLGGFGMEAARIETIAERLPDFFARALHDEWKRHEEIYKPLLATSPFASALQRETEWEVYYTFLRQQTAESLLQETFGLKQVYVPLRAYYEKHTRRDGEEDELSGSRSFRQHKRPRVIVDLQAQLDEWLQKGDAKDALRVVSGGPGSGKSSFGKMWVEHLTTRSDLRVIFIPLHRFDHEGSLESALAEFVKNDEFLSELRVGSSKGPRLVLFFDGLDELSMRGALAEEGARNFVQEIQAKLPQWNRQKLQVQVVVSGREVVIQANSTNLREEGQVLHVLPYREKPQADDINSEILKEDQRNQWWQKYGQATGKDYPELPERLRHEDLDEITAQPLLNYLVALSYSGGGNEENKLDFSGTINRNIIYYDLLRKVYRRGWEDGRNLAASGLNEAQFIRVLEEIALATWHGNGRTTTVGAIEAHCQSSGLTNLLQQYEQAAKAGVARLLTAFYFRQFGAESSGDKTFEFTHKSFGEYLMARRVVQAIRRIAVERERHANFEGGWDELNALKHWAEICGPAPLNYNVLRFLREEITLCKDNGADVAAWQQMFCRLIEVTLRHGTPMELLTPRQSYKKEDEQARNAEEGLLAALSSCALSAKTLSKIVWPDEFTVRRWFIRLQTPMSNEPTLTPYCLSFLDLRKCFLWRTQIGEAELRGANLQGADLSSAFLQIANFQGANLQDADLSSTSLEASGLQGANLQDADLTYASLSYAGFQDANLQGANLEGADLEEANLEGANLRGANLQKGKLLDANLRDANLRGADLRDANLRGADLRGADLRGADIKGADIKGALGLAPEMKDECES